MTGRGTQVELGDASHRAGHALCFAPVLQRWDGGECLSAVTRPLLARGYRVTVVDTLCLLAEGLTDVRQLADRWHRQLPRIGELDLLVGNALGGAVAQALLGTVRPRHGVLLVSAPTRTDAALDRKLGAVAALAEQGAVDEAAALLHRLVQPQGEPPAAPGATAPPAGPSEAGAGDEGDAEAGRRVGRGLRLLMGTDVVAEARAYEGPLVHVVGSRSQLVTTAHVAGAAHHRTAVVDGAGMRPHRTHPAAFATIMDEFLDERIPA